MSVDARNQLFTRHGYAIRSLDGIECDTIKVMGDSNLPNLRWINNDHYSNMLPTNVTTNIEIFVMEAFTNEGLKQINGIGNFMGRILDLIYTSDCDNVTVIESKSPFSDPDRLHPPLEVTIEIFSSIPE